MLAIHVAETFDLNLYRTFQRRGTLYISGSFKLSQMSVILDHSHKTSMLWSVYMHKGWGYRTRSNRTDCESKNFSIKYWD